MTIQIQASDQLITTDSFLFLLLEAEKRQAVLLFPGPSTICTIDRAHARAHTHSLLAPFFLFNLIHNTVYFLSLLSLDAVMVATDICSLCQPELLHH